MNCSWGYRGRRDLLQEELINATCWCLSTSDAFQVAIWLLVVTTWEYIREHKQCSMCKAPNVEDDILNVFNLSAALLFAHGSSHGRKIVGHDKCSGMGSCSWIYSSRRVSLYEVLISATCSWTSSITKVMPLSHHSTACGDYKRNI